MNGGTLPMFGEGETAVARKAGADERDRLLRSLRRRVFDRFRYQGSDALVAHVPEDAPIPPAVQAKIGEPVASRWYPVEAGHLVKWRHDGEIPSEDFWIETGGWNHEHCDGCNRSIEVEGTAAWLTVRGSFYKLCPYCYRRVAQLGRVSSIGSTDRRTTLKRPSL
jgi:hypothetical protein